MVTVVHQIDMIPPRARLVQIIYMKEIDPCLREFADIVSPRCTPQFIEIVITEIRVVIDALTISPVVVG
jgi:hypothetical protein